MLFEIKHVTQYHYAEPVRESVMEVWMQPQKGARQRLEAELAFGRIDEILEEGRRGSREGAAVAGGELERVRRAAARKTFIHEHMRADVFLRSAPP